MASFENQTKERKEEQMMVWGLFLLILGLKSAGWHYSYGFFKRLFFFFLLIL